MTRTDDPTPPTKQQEFAAALAGRFTKADDAKLLLEHLEEAEAALRSLITECRPKPAPPIHQEIRIPKDVDQERREWIWKLIDNLPEELREYYLAVKSRRHCVTFAWRSYRWFGYWFYVSYTGRGFGFIFRRWK